MTSYIYNAILHSLKNSLEFNIKNVIVYDYIINNASIITK
jgi:hypothetical protein